MCGFAGLVAFDDRYRISPQVLERMSARIAHRGPDGQGILLNHPGPATAEQPQVGLVFRRLAILDLDPRAMQPMADGRRWIVFNGEIYNFRELRRELDLSHPGYDWKTTGDTEVILRAYDAWGEQCVDHLNGMFAFVIYDAADRSLFLARDRMGQKPLYCAMSDDGQAIAFASELGAMKAVDWISTEIDSHGLIEYLRWGYVPSGRSIYRQISSIPPGMTGRLARGRGESVSYFNPNVAWGATPQNTTESTRRLVTQAVRRQLVADVPVGCFLSGGIDSSIVAAVMKASAATSQPVLTFSIGFEDPRYDETPFAAAVANHLGTEHRQFIVQADAAADLPKLAEVYGEPFGDSSALPTHYLSRETRAFVKVALSGDGGDELFGGYDRYRAMGLAARLDRLPALRNVISHPRLRGIPGSHPKSKLARAKRFAASLALSRAQRYAQYMALFSNAQISDLLSDRFKEERAQSVELIDDFERLMQGNPGLHLPPRDEVQAAMAVDRISYLPGDLLTKVDRASMLHALEVRSPFMDHDLVKFAAGLSTANLIKGGPKRMLREAFAADLPRFVFRRRKMGFAVPIGQWLRTTLRPMFNDLVFASDSFASANFNLTAVRQWADEHQSGTDDHSQRLYALLMLELWHKST